MNSGGNIIIISVGAERTRGGFRREGGFCEGQRVLLFFSFSGERERSKQESIRAGSSKERESASEENSVR